jgi:hypothetical protein
MLVAADNEPAVAKLGDRAPARLTLDREQTAVEPDDAGSVEPELRQASRRSSVRS